MLSQQLTENDSLKTRTGYGVLLKKRTGQNSRRGREFSKTDNTLPARFLNSFNISDIDQLILALILRFGVILV